MPFLFSLYRVSDNYYAATTIATTGRSISGTAAAAAGVSSRINK
jgi:hypothetical protein